MRAGILSATVARKRSTFITTCILHAIACPWIEEELKELKVPSGPPSYVGCNTIRKLFPFVQRIDKTSLNAIIERLDTRSSYVAKTLRDFLSTNSPTEANLIDSLEDRARVLSMTVLETKTPTAEPAAVGEHDVDYMNKLPFELFMLCVSPSPQLIMERKDIESLRLVSWKYRSYLNDVWLSIRARPRLLRQDGSSGRQRILAVFNGTHHSRATPVFYLLRKSKWQQSR
jgi:hypothetical protein